jgi:hypothetical protein
MNTYIKYFTILLFANCTFHSAIKAQTPIKKEVEVVKPYEPVISDAYKINVLPKINDSVIIKPSFEYNIVPAMFKTEYQVNQINAAKMVSMPLSKLYKGYLKLGYGNYYTPLAEIYVNSLRSKKYATGIFLHHQSSGGKIKLDNKQKVFAGYSESSANVFGKRFFNKSYLYGEGGISGNTDYQYGYRPDTIAELEKGEIRQTLFMASVKAGLRSSHSDSSKLRYHFGGGYNFMQNRFKESQNEILLRAEGERKYKKLMVGVSTYFNMIKPNSKLDSIKNNNTVFNLHPNASYTTSEYRFLLGLDINFEKQLGKLSFRPYPFAEININIAKDVIKGFVGLKGYLHQHNYASIVNDNPFIIHDLQIKNTYYRSINYGGLKGNLGARASYVAKIEFSKIRNAYFFINDTVSKLQNEFNVVYDNFSLMNLYFDISYDITPSIALGAKLNYYQYQMEVEEHAWNRPDYDFTISSKYNLRNKILVELDVVGLGNRYAKEFEAGQPVSVKLPSVVDFNLGVEYRYTKILSGWLRLNNFTASKYYSFNHYPTQRFNVMFGITYSM